jgi:hypothetical protein
LALTPDTPDESFVREVDENLRRDELESFAKAYAKWLIGAVVLFLIAVGAYLYWQNRQSEKSAAQSEQLMAAYNDIGAKKADEAKKKLDTLAAEGNSIVRAMAVLAEAAVALEANDRDTAIAKYHSVAADEDIADPYRNVALVRATTLEFDKLKPQDVIGRLEPLAKSGEPWFGSAGELTALAYLKMGQKDKAGRLFAEIAADKQVPETIRSRSLQFAGTLGVDTGKLPPQPAQPGMFQ